MLMFLRKLWVEVAEILQITEQIFSCWCSAGYSSRCVPAGATRIVDKKLHFLLEQRRARLRWAKVLTKACGSLPVSYSFFNPSLGQLERKAPQSPLTNRLLAKVVSTARNAIAKSTACRLFMTSFIHAQDFLQKSSSSQPMNHNLPRKPCWVEFIA